ncbi:hypothetical protein PSE10B_29490 [Pseudomonas amygdali pv. eriobotryae]|nr:hypothetical protein PSE10B_29490 [Pseudomonas amygdali pv. eriobotryae]
MSLIAEASIVLMLLPDYRATLRVACRSGLSASGLEGVARHRFVTQSVTHGIPTLEREER